MTSIADKILSLYKNDKSDCMIEAGVLAISGKWKPLLLFHMLSGAKRFSELKKAVSQASDRMLTRSLRELEQDGLVHRAVFAQVPVKVEYSLTKDGEALIPILDSLNEWSQNKAKNNTSNTI